jgi:predicted RNase H-like HicB family nuclease
MSETYEELKAELKEIADKWAKVSQEEREDVLLPRVAEIRKAMIELKEEKDSPTT